MLLRKSPAIFLTEDADQLELDLVIESLEEHFQAQKQSLAVGLFISDKAPLTGEVEVAMARGEAAAAGR